jgi:2'-5' RNA ligase
VLDLRFAGAGRFGDRVLWVGVQGDRDRLRALAGGLATDGRPYRPHLTLARVRPGADPRQAATMLAAYDGPGWRAVEVVLFRSHLGPKPTHEPLARWPLPADPSPRK